MQGEWGEVNDTVCNYVSEVTDKLYKFANMNHTGFHQTTLLQAAGMVPGQTEGCNRNKLRDRRRGTTVCIVPG